MYNDPYDFEDGVTTSQRQKHRHCPYRCSSRLVQFTEPEVVQPARSRCTYETLQPTVVRQSFLFVRVQKFVLRFKVRTCTVAF
jgi:TFIIF-interacting CTD phosphatase-like protein